MNLLRLFANRADHFRATFPQDAAGGYTVATATCGNYPCSIQPKSVNRFADLHGIEGAKVTHVGYFSTDHIFKLEDRLIPSAGPGVGKVYVCQGPARDQAGRGIVWVVDLVEVV